MMVKDKITIVLACDDNYAQHAAVAAASVLLSTVAAKRVQFYILGDRLNSKNKKRLQDTIQQLGGMVFFPDVSGKVVENGYISGHLSRAAYFRLALPDIVPGNIEKAIYLDTDLVVFDDVVKLWEIDMNEKPVGAICDYGIMASKHMRQQKQKTLGLQPGQSYFNSGVMVIDLNQWRKKEYAVHLMEIVKCREFRHHDQDALNETFKNNWCELPLRWNVIPPVFNLFFKLLCRSDLRNHAITAKRNPAVFHWAGRYKPWEFIVHPGFNDSYYYYLKQTAFADEPMPKPGNIMQGKSIMRQLWRLRIADMWVKIL